MNKENKTPKLKGLKCDTIFKIPVSGGFHSRVIDVLTFITKDMLPKDYEEVILFSFIDFHFHFLQ